MKTGTLISTTSGLLVMSLILLIVVSFSTEVSAKRGCSAFGHSCFGGHGKRSNGIIENRFKNAHGSNSESSDYKLRGTSTETEIIPNGNVIQQLRGFISNRNRAIELSHSQQTAAKYIPLQLRQLLTSYRRSYTANMEPED